MRSGGHEQESHFMAIAVALLLSAGLHICFLFFFRDYTLTSAVRERIAGMFNVQPAPMKVRRINDAKSLSRIINGETSKSGTNPF